MNSALTRLNTLTVRGTTKPIPTNTHSGDTISTGNGTRRNTLKSVTTGSNQFALRKATNRKYDFEKPQNSFSKCLKNYLIINTILETQSYFDIILIQELPWFVICKVSSTSSSKGENLIGTVHHPNWLLFTINSVNKATSPRVTAYINICLSFLCFSLQSDIINYTDILLILFTNNHTQYFIMNIYSDSSYLALKYLKDIEVSIDNVLVMTGDFNIRDSLWNPVFPHYSFISDDLLIIIDFFHLALSTPTNPYSTRYSDTVGEVNLTIDLIFLWYGLTELNQHSIHPDWRLTSDHTPLFITIPIVDEIINTSKLLIQQNSEQETTFIEEVILAFKNLNTLNISNKECLENTVNNLNSLIN